MCEVFFSGVGFYVGLIVFLDQEVQTSQPKYLRNTRNTSFFHISHFKSAPGARPNSILAKKVRYFVQWSNICTMKKIDLHRIVSVKPTYFMICFNNFYVLGYKTKYVFFYGYKKIFKIQNFILKLITSIVFSKQKW